MPLNRRDMIKVAHYYYDFGYNQQQIAEKFQMSRPRVIRLLKQALEEGIVEIKVRDLSNEKLESELEIELGLKEAVVADTSDINTVSIEYLADTVQSGWNIGVSSGTTIAKLSAIPVMLEKRDVNFVQLMGGINTNNLGIRPDEVTLRFAKIFGGKAYVLFAPAIVDNPGLAKMIMQERQYKDISLLYDNLDIAVVTVGVLSKKNMLIEAGYLSEKDYYDLEKKNCIGDIIMHFIDSNGNIVDEQFDERVMSIPLEKFKKINLRVGIVYGEKKEKSIMAALNGGYINVLITDADTAKRLLELRRQKDFTPV